MGDIHQLFSAHVHARMYKDGTPMPFGFLVLGLVGEGGELVDELARGPADYDENKVSVINEMGDVLWYLEGIIQNKFPGRRTTDLVRVDDGKNVFHHYCKVAELAKKDAWHGKPAPQPELIHHLGAILRELESVASFWSFTIEDAMRANIIKLKKRYPMGFVEGGGVRDAEPPTVVGYDVGYDAKGMYL